MCFRLGRTPRVSKLHQSLEQLPVADSSGEKEAGAVTVWRLAKTKRGLRGARWIWGVDGFAHIYAGSLVLLRQGNRNAHYERVDF